MKSRANRNDVLEDINSFSTYNPGRRYVNGERLDSERNGFETERLIDLSRSKYITVSMAVPGEAKEDGYFPGMGMGGPYCTDSLKDTPISYTLTLTEVV